MSTVEVKFGEWIQKGFDLFKANMGLLIVAALLAYVLAGITIGILLGPMMAGLILIVLALIDKREPKPADGDLFKGFECFLQAFLLVLVVGLPLLVVSMILMLIPCVGWLVSLALQLGASTAVMFALPLVADKKMAFWPAIMASFEMVKRNFFSFLGLMLVSAVISGIGSIACGIGVIVTAPIGICIMAVAYRELFSAAPAAGATEAVPSV